MVLYLLELSAMQISRLWYFKLS